MTRIQAARYLIAQAAIELDHTHKQQAKRTARANGRPETWLGLYRAARSAYIRECYKALEQPNT